MTIKVTLIGTGVCKGTEMSLQTVKLMSTGLDH